MVLSECSRCCKPKTEITTQSMHICTLHHFLKGQTQEISMATQKRP